MMASHVFVSLLMFCMTCFTHLFNKMVCINRFQCYGKWGHQIPSNLKQHGKKKQRKSEIIKKTLSTHEMSEWRNIKLRNTFNIYWKHLDILQELPRAYKYFLHYRFYYRLFASHSRRKKPDYTVPDRSQSDKVFSWISVTFEDWLISSTKEKGRHFAGR